MIDTNLADLRKTYSKMELTERSVSADPFQQFGKWMNEALGADVPEPTAMTLGTASGEGRPSSRVVLLKGFDQSGFVFYTNYESKKGADLLHNPFTIFHFFWPQLDRQIAIYGRVEKTSREESEEYFNSRPVDSRIGAWTSNQSRVIESREALEKRFEEFREKFGDNVPLPPYWGGFRLTPDKFEFWQGRQNRLHDRICYTLIDHKWEISRLSP